MADDQDLDTDVFKDEYTCQHKHGIRITITLIMRWIVGIFALVVALMEITKGHIPAFIFAVLAGLWSKI
jgi:hypothetical protein